MCVCVFEPSMLRFTPPAFLVRFRMEKPSTWQQSTLYSGSIGLKRCEFQDGLCFFACTSTIYICIYIILISTTTRTLMT